jgi:hypothetical protein
MMMILMNSNHFEYKHEHFVKDLQVMKQEIHRLNILLVMMLVKVHVEDYQYILIEVIDQIFSIYL